MRPARPRKEHIPAPCSSPAPRRANPQPPPRLHAPCARAHARPCLRPARDNRRAPPSRAAARPPHVPLFGLLVSARPALTLTHDLTMTCPVALTCKRRHYCMYTAWALARVAKWHWHQILRGHCAGVPIIYWLSTWAICREHWLHHQH